MVALVALVSVTSITARALVPAGRKAKKSADYTSKTPRKPRLVILSEPTMTVDRWTAGRGGFDVKASASAW